MTRFTLALAAAMAFAFSAQAWAQTNRIGGVVRDETGATIRGAIVRAETGGTNTSASPVTLTTATDDRGRFVFVVTRSGEWRLTLEAPGFEAQTIPLAVRLGGAAPNLDVKLERRESPEAFGALAGVDSKLLSAQLEAAAVLYRRRAPRSGDCRVPRNQVTGACVVAGEYRLEIRIWRRSPTRRRKLPTWKP